MEPIIDPESRLIEKLAALRMPAERDPDKARLGKAAFLQQAAEMGRGVTLPEKRRHMGWLHAIQSTLVPQRKERSPMFGTLTTLVIIFSLVFGGGGATLAAAQISQPDQLLYGVKLLSEDLRLGLAAEPQAEYQLALEFADRRAAEISVLAQSGSAMPETVQTRYQIQVEQAIQSAVALADGQAVTALEQVRARLQTQQNALAQAHSSADATLAQVRQMLQERLQWVENGIKDPVGLREQLRQRDQDRLHQTPRPTQGTVEAGSPGPRVTGTPVPGSGGCTTCTPPATPPGGPNPQVTPTGMGPQPTMIGPGPQPTHSGPMPTMIGPGPQATHVGPGPQATQVGPGPQATHVGPGPQATQVGPGPQATQVGPGPQPTQVGPGPQPTLIGPQPTHTGPGPQQTPGGSNPTQIGPGPGGMGGRP